MKIYPAIDIKDSKCVRLIQGSFDRQTVYSDNVMEMAFKWSGMGAEYLHIVDLDGARTGIQTNLPLILDIARKVGIPIQTGGGIRTAEAAGRLLDGGVSRVILGTAAIKVPEIVKEAVSLFGDKIAVGIDVKDGYAYTDGWEKTGGIKAVELAQRMESLGVRCIIYTDISRDGMLGGPNLDAMEKMKGSVGIEIIASGGVSSLEDVRKLRDAGMDGAIIGKALYTGAIDVRQAIKIGKKGDLE